jgi:two-component system, chemotaxis family, sensor kinase CheA
VIVASALSTSHYPLKHQQLSLSTMYIDDEELRGLYKTSSVEHIQTIESALMQLEKQPHQPEVLKELLRSAHTFKGDSRMLGVETVETLVHQIEECLMPIDKGQATLSAELCDRLYLGIDTIKQLAHTAVTGEPNNVDLFYVLALLMGDGGAAPPPADREFKQKSSLQIQEHELFESAATLPEIGDLTSGDLSVSLTSALAENGLFDLPADRWMEIETTNNPSLNPPPSSLQANFLDLGMELFPSDSTLPGLDRGAVFNDFVLIPNHDDLVAPDRDSFSIESLSLEAEDLKFDLDREFDSIASLSDEVEIDNWEFSAEANLFSNEDNNLMPIDEDFLGLELSQIEEGLEIEPIAVAPISPAPAPKDAQINPVADYQIETIRVEAKQLDTLMGQTGEINVLNQQIANRLTDLDAFLEIWDDGNREYQNIQTLLQQIPSHSPLHRYLHRTYRQWEEMGELISKFKKSIDSDSSRLDLVASALESGVKKLRLLPLTTVLNLFPRMVRDLAKTQSKEINLTIEGGDLFLDKRLLEEIKDPLMHILRNAIDHGIETPAERQQQGKLPTATLKIQVRQTGDRTTIEISDDGRGLDLKQIKAKAIERGLHTEAELASMSVDRIQSLIFAPGFSTRSRVTELSGRGVGLDIVRTNIERLKGSVEIESMLNRGCTFRIQLTHSIGSSQVMMVEVRDRVYAIPVEFVDRMLLLDKAEIFALGGTPTTKIDGKTLTVAWLADLLDLPAIAPNFPGEVTRISSNVNCLLLQSGQQQLALLVDTIRDRQLVTIESLHPVLKNVPHLAGATILGTGEICLILNPLDLFTTVTGANALSPHVGSELTKIPVAAATPTILLVEDSVVIRTQLQRILGGAGYQVTVAVDGLEGWEKLQSGKFDLVVSDVEMPRWSGLELTKQIRTRSEYQHLPVILVTTLSQVADRDRGFQAGANAYLTKGDFDQKLLLDTLTRLI